MDTPGSQVTSLLMAAGNGDSRAAEQLWDLLYDELHRVAKRQMGREGQAGDLQTTVLVHEAYLRLVGDPDDPAALHNRRYFFAAAAKAMRRIRVDDARRRGRLKRGGGQAPGQLACEPGVCDADPAEVLAVNEALDRLQQHDPRKAEIVMLRYFAGLSIDETAESLGLAPRTVDNEWRFARVWLHRELTKGDTRGM